jgi:hypothetical protein
MCDPSRVKASYTQAYYPVQFLGSITIPVTAEGAITADPARLEKSPLPQAFNQLQGNLKLGAKANL